MTKHFFSFLLTIAVAMPALGQLKYPHPAKGPVTDDYFGAKVADPYRALENTDAPETAAWVEAENKVTFDYLDKIPFRAKIKARLEQLLNYPKYTTPVKVGKYYIFQKNDGLQNQFVVYIQEGLNGTPRVLLDPNSMSSDGTVSLGGIYPSKDDKYVAYSIQKAGSDWQEIFVLDPATGKKLDDHIQWMKFSGADWMKDGFFYSRFDAPAEGTFTSKNEFMKVYYHKLGTDQSKDQLIYEDKTNGARQFYASTTEDERYIQMYVREPGKKGNLLFVKDNNNPSKGFVPVNTDFEIDCGLLESMG